MALIDGWSRVTLVSSLSGRLYTLILPVLSAVRVGRTAVACDTDKLPGINKLPPPRRFCTSPPCYLQKVSAGLAFYLFVVKCVSCPELMSLHTALLILSAPPHEIHKSSIPDGFVMHAATASLHCAVLCLMAGNQRRWLFFCCCSTQWPFLLEN